jgi:hypothetical protein
MPSGRFFLRARFNGVLLPQSLGNSSISIADATSTATLCALSQAGGMP